MQLRHAVRTFINTADHPNAVQFRRNYQNYAAIANNESWDQYWERMSQDREWADYIFIQATAWFLNHDIMIITTSNTDENPVIIVSGNINDESTPCPYATLTIGSKSNIHYQSLLPIEAFHLTEFSISSQKQTNDAPKTNSKNIKRAREPHHDNVIPNIDFEKDTKLFKYRSENTDINFLIRNDGLIQCYYCQKSFKLIVQHIKQKQECRANINIEDLKAKLAIFNNSTSAQRNAKSRKLKKERDPEGLKDAEAQRKAKSRQKKMENDPEGLKTSEAQRKANSRANKVAINFEGLKADEAKRKAKSRGNKVANNSEGLKADEAKRKAKSRGNKVASNSEGLKADEAKRKAKSRSNKVANNSEGLKADEAKRKAKSRGNKVASNSEGLKADEAKRKAKSRSNKVASNSEGLKAAEALRKAKSRQN